MSIISNVASAFAKRDGDDEACSSKSEYSGSFGLRILAIFIVLISSCIGSFLPIVAKRFSKTKLLRGGKATTVLNVVNFIAKYFGSGVIFATAFIHLLASGAESLTSPCLGGAFQEYPFVYAIAMLSIFILYLMEMVSRHYVNLYVDKNSNGPSHTHGNFDFLLEEDSEHGHVHAHDQSLHTQINAAEIEANGQFADSTNEKVLPKSDETTDNNLDNDKNDLELSTTQSSAESALYNDSMSQKDYINQIFALFVLEFGIIFHSVWVGLSVGVAGSEFKVLFIVIVFHQMFEGLGLSARIAECKWPKSKKNTPYYMAAAYGVTTPIAIAIGVGVRHSLSMNSLGILLVSGIADSISGGILLYNSFELLFGAFEDYPGNLKMKLWSYFTTCWGVGLMALLGKWA